MPDSCEADLERRKNRRGRLQLLAAFGSWEADIGEHIHLRSVCLMWQRFVLEGRYANPFDKGRGIP